jgi:hypothetical protein
LAKWRLANHSLLGCQASWTTTERISAIVNAGQAKLWGYRWGVRLQFWGGLEQGGEAQAAGADAQFGEVEGLHNGLVYGYPREDDVGAVLRQANDLLALFERQTPEPFEVPGNPRGGQAGGLEPSPVERRELSLHAPEYARCAAHADQLRHVEAGCGVLRIPRSTLLKSRPDFLVQEIL